MQKLQKQHFVQAADYITRNPIPKRREIKDWAVLINGNNVPPKLALSVALYFSGDNREICSGSTFVTSQAVRILKDFDFKPTYVKKYTKKV